MTRINKLQYLLCLSLMMIIWLYADVTYSQPRIIWSVVDGGGGGINTGNYAISDSIGQPVTGTLSNGQYSIYTGFYGTNIVSDSIFAQKEIDWDRELSGVFPGDTIHYSITVTNFFDNLISFLIQDALDAYVEYLAGTFYVNDVQESDDWFSDGLLDYQSDALGSGETLTLTFDVMVDCDAPLDWIIENTALVTAYSSLDPSSPLVTLETNTTKTKVVPEASTLLLLGTGLLGLFVLVQRRWNRGK